MKTKNFLKFNKGQILRTAILSAVLLFVSTAFAFNQHHLAGKADTSNCDAKYTGTNSSDNTIQIIAFQVKIHGGWWANVIPSQTVFGTGVTTTGNCGTAVGEDLPFNCDVQRRYRIKLQRNYITGGKITKSVKMTNYANFPSSTGWTTDKTVDFGDVDKIAKK